VRKYLWDDEIIPRERAAEVAAASEADFARFGYGLWTVSDRETGGLIGFCGLRRTPPGPPELLYGLRPSAWGKGLATESARAVLRYAFLELRLDEITAATDVPNTASARVMERLGMRFERRGVLNGLDTVFYRIDIASFVPPRVTGSREQERS
jgi:RimJ/RimL family protein N-acetyltransferase